MNDNNIDKVSAKRKEIINALKMDRFITALGLTGVGTCALTWNQLHEHIAACGFDGWYMAYFILALSSLTTLSCEIERLDEDKEWLNSFDNIHDTYERKLK